MLSVRHADPGHAVGVVGRVLAIVFRRAGSVEDFERLAAIVRELEDGPLHEYVVLSVTGEDVPVALDKPVRAAITALVREFEERTIGTATVILGSGARSAIMRSVLTGVLIATRSARPIRVFSQLDVAAAWCAELLDEPDRAGPLVAALEQLFAAAQG